MSFAEEMYDADSFGNLSLGRAKKDNVIGFDVSPGLFNQLPLYNLTYSRIVEGGKGEISFSTTYNNWLKGPYSEHTVEDGQKKLQQNSFLLLGGGLKYRVFDAGIEEGLFYGVGGRILLWWWKYAKPVLKSKTVPSGLKEEVVFFQTFIPHGELGYLQPLDVNWSILGSAELGFALSTFEPLEYGNEKNDNIYGNQQDENGKVIPGKMLFWTINLGVRYAF